MINIIDQIIQLLLIQGGTIECNAEKSFAVPTYWYFVFLYHH